MTFTLTADQKQIEKIKNYYKAFLTPNNNQYVQYFFKSKTFSITCYTSGKVVFQGTDSIMEFEKWGQAKAKEKIKETTIYDTKKYSIGSDEVGTGDYFGPIIVVSAYVDPESRKFLEKYKITDSKVLQDKYILEIGKDIMENIKHEMIYLSNPKFNDLSRRGFNMNCIKALMHNLANYKMANAYQHDEIVIDQFTTVNSYYKYLDKEKHVQRDITFQTKAESKYLSVAVASVLARFYFLHYFKKLETDCGYTLKKGADAKVDQIALGIASIEGIEYLNEIAKTKFKNTEKIKNMM